MSRIADDEHQVRRWADALVARGRVRLTPGLTLFELMEIEATYGISFPPDLAQFLRHAVPIGESWPDWRSDPEEAIRRQMRRPWEDLLLLIEKYDFWLPIWGARPRTPSGVQEIARRKIEAAPALIPLCGYQYLLAEPREAGNPVISWWIDDAIVFAKNLGDYLTREYGCPDRQTLPRIEFWSDVLDWIDADAKPRAF